MTKISELTPGTAVSSDKIPIERGNDNYYIIPSDFPVSTPQQTALDDKANRSSGLLTGGTIVIVSSTTIRVSSSTYYIIGFGTLSSIQTDFAGITLSSAGNQRYVGIYGTTSNTISKVEGVESALAAFPAQPADTALIGYVLVGDASLGTTPDLSGYMPKSDKATAADVNVGADDTKYITALALKNGRKYSIQIACSDESTAITGGASKVTFRMPFAMTLTAVRASLSTAQAAGSIFTIDINEAGTTVLSTKLTIDNNEKTSVTAVTPPVISDASLADDAEITIDVDQIGTSGATGLKITLIGTR